MSLPPFVIQHATMRDAKGVLMMLGNTGWTTFRPQVLSFGTRKEGEEWIVEARKVTPKLFASSDPKVVEVKDNAMPDGSGATSSDFEPFRENA